jgi:hypothetical protein
LINNVKVPANKVITYYAKHGSVSSIKLLQSMIEYVFPILFLYCHRLGDEIFIYNLFPVANAAVLVWAIEEFKNKYTSSTASIYLSSVVKGGFLEVLKSLNVDQPHLRTILYIASQEGHLHILNWVKDNFTLKTPKSTYTGILDWELECSEEPILVERITDNTSFSEIAAEVGRLDVVMWLHSNGFDWDFKTCRNAALNGHFDLLKWARVNGCPWNEPCCAAAAAIGHLEMLKWLRENGCPWGSLTCANAAENGNLETLKWAIDNGCPWDKNIFVKAFNKGHMDIVDWGKSQGYIK